MLIKCWAGEPEPGVFGSLEPEPLEKKQGAGAAWKKSQEPEPAGEYNLTFALPPPQGGGGGRNQKSEIREENSKLIRKRRDKKG
jgi:hypothetical protein